MEPLKDTIFNEMFFKELSEALQKNYNKFNQKKFKAYIYDTTWPDLELKERMRRYSEGLKQFIDLDYRKTIAVLKKVVPNISDKFATMIFPDYVELYGLEDFDESIEALEFFTQYGSSEFSIRPFFIKYPKQTLAVMKKWAKHENEHVRRLASEGCRPRLPWAMALPDFKKDPKPILPILKTLNNDKSLYVRKSVANNLNDIAKDNPDVVVKIAQEWYGKRKNTDWIVKHACRTLLKQGQPQVMALFGFDPTAIKVDSLKLSARKVKIGKSFHFEFTVKRNPKVKSAIRLRLEYGIDFVKKTGKSSRKIFQISESDFDGKRKIIRKEHSFKNLSTRTHHPGKHSLVVIANGKVYPGMDFTLS